MVQILALSLLGVPNFLWDRLAESSIDFDVGEFQFLVDLGQVLAVEDDKDVSLWEHSFAEVVIESLIS